LREIRTEWAKVTPPYGAFDDYVILESKNRNERFLMRTEEFDFLLKRLHNNLQFNQFECVQILREWNKCIGFEDFESKPSLITDKENFVGALKFLKVSEHKEFGKLETKDLKKLTTFISDSINDNVWIWKV